MSFGTWIKDTALPWIGENVLGLGDIGLNSASIVTQADIANKNYAQAEKWNQLNYENQLENQQYNRDLQQTIFQREDNAVQRRVADLKAAGLSPTLAAGTGAGAGSVVSSVAAQHGFTPKDASAYKQIANFELYNNLKLQKQKSLEMDLNIEQLQHALDIYKKTGTLPGDNSSLATLLRFFGGPLGMDLTQYGEKIGYALDAFLNAFMGNSTGDETPPAYSSKIELHDAADVMDAPGVNGVLEQARVYTPTPAEDIKYIAPFGNEDGKVIFMDIPDNESIDPVGTLINLYQAMPELSRLMRRIARHNHNKPTGGTSGANYKAVYVK